MASSWGENLVALTGLLEDLPPSVLAVIQEENPAFNDLLEACQREIAEGGW